MAALMLQGTASSVGKSLLTTGLARAIQWRGIDVVPFKAQNISNNARVVEGGEIGTAQYLQALAAGIEPNVLMNPVLVKPEGGDRSQVVLLGKVDEHIGRLPWRSRSQHLWPIIEHSLRRLMTEHELVLIEGAGSPAEPNLHHADLANMPTATAADARVLLVADIDRGGAFAHLYGTWALVSPSDRHRFLGFVLNKFRGDPALLSPATELLGGLTGVPTLGVIPWLEHGLPDEDGAATPVGREGRPTVAVVRYPHASNLDEFKQLEQVTDMCWADRPDQIQRSDLAILPGSKHVAADLSWLASTEIAAALKARARAGRPLLGICGGMQMLGLQVEDQAGVDGSADGLALLPLRTIFASAKRTTRTTTRFNSLSEPWKVLSRKPVSGYEIRHGRTVATSPVQEALPDGLGYISGAVLGIYVHGLFEEPEILADLFQERPRWTLEQAFDELADAIEQHLDLQSLLRWVRVR